MEYQTVYDFADETIRLFPSIIPLLMALGCYFIALSNYHSDKKEDCAPLVVIGTGLLILGAWVIYANISGYFETQDLYNRQQYQVIEGVVENFDPMPYGGHRNESFTMKGVSFYYSDFDATYNGFNNTASHGGPFRKGLHARLAYFTNAEGRNIILKIEIPGTGRLTNTSNFAAYRILCTRFAKWLTVFGWIFGGAMLFAASITGVYRACHNLFGYVNVRLFGDDPGAEIRWGNLRESVKTLIVRMDSWDVPSALDKEPLIGALSDCILSSGVCSLIGGVIWFLLAYYEIVGERECVVVMGLAAIVGMCYCGVRRVVGYSNPPLYDNLVFSATLGALLGGIASGMLMMVVDRKMISLFVGGIFGMFGGGLVSIYSICKAAGVLSQTYMPGRVKVIHQPYMSGRAGIIHHISRGMIRMSDLGIGTLAGGSVGVAASVLGSPFIGIIGFIGIMAVGKLMPFSVNLLAQVISAILTKLLCLLRFRAVICGGCLRYTFPMKSAYEQGVRYCEHCQQPVERTDDAGKVIFTFGKIPFQPTARTFLFAEPGFQLLDHVVDVTDVYLDADTCDPLQVERFITYIVNYPPTYGVRSVKIMYQGNLDALGDNLKNALYNNFTYIVPL